MSPAVTRFLLASRSEDKAREIARILAPVGITVETLAAAGVPTSAEEDDIEAFDTFATNAIAKARYFAERTGRPVLADDSGIKVDALGGAPGVRSRRFSGRSDLSGQALDDANNAALLERLTGLPPERRRARYVCAAVALTPGHAPVVAVGSVSGTVLDAPRGAGGFGYDPLFLPDGENLTFGELPPAAKDRISHRSRAFRALATALA